MPLMQQLRAGLIVSCQAEPGDPFNRPEYLALFARAAEMGGAVGIRARETENVRAIRQSVALPIIGLTKGKYEDGSVLITPSIREVEALLEAGADVVAVDATHRPRPGAGPTGTEFVADLRSRFPDVPLMADVSTLAEAVDAERAGANVVGTTLAGYTPGSAPAVGPDWRLLREVVAACAGPVILEGRVSTPAHARRGLRLGAFAVVVGTAITRPRVMVETYVQAMVAMKQPCA